LIVFYFWCFNATFNNISAGDHKQATGKFYHLRCESSAPFFNLQSRAIIMQSFDGISTICQMD
jgi:hypothetical protein